MRRVGRHLPSGASRLIVAAACLALAGAVGGSLGGAVREGRSLEHSRPATVSLRPPPSLARVPAGWATPRPLLARTGQSITWCGAEPSTEDRKPDVEISSEQQVHVLYVLPADGADRFSQLASALATDVGAIDSWWQGQDVTRRPRWDLFAFPGCTTRAGMLDLRVVRLPQSAAAYADSNEISPLIGDLVAVLGRVEKALVYYDGPRTERDICGTSTMSALYAGKYAFAFLWLVGSCNGDLGTGGVAAAVAAHELVHDLGAVSLEGPPHGCQADGMAGHVCESTSDLMFPYSHGLGITQLILDVGHDDYYAHGGTWWDVQDSAWLTRLPQRHVTVAVKGSGKIVSQPAAIDCPAGDCDAVLDDGLAVALTAQPEAGSRLWSWAGACSGWSPRCVPKRSGDSSVVATFGPTRYRVSVRVSGRGRVTSLPAGIDCGRTCGSWFAPGANVRLLAKPLGGWRLARWTGACRGTATCRPTGGRDSVVNAVFVRKASG